MLTDEQMFRGRLTFFHHQPRKHFLEDSDQCDRVAMKEFADLWPSPKVKTDDHLNVERRLM
jgi:hypothetical protein